VISCTSNEVGLMVLVVPRRMRPGGLVEIVVIPAKA
jgi:hypothetical protein